MYKWADLEQAHGIHPCLGAVAHFSLRFSMPFIFALWLGAVALTTGFSSTKPAPEGNSRRPLADFSFLSQCDSLCVELNALAAFARPWLPPGPSPIDEAAWSDGLPRCRRPSRSAFATETAAFTGPSPAVFVLDVIGGCVRAGRDRRLPSCWTFLGYQCPTSARQLYEPQPHPFTPKPVAFFSKSEQVSTSPFLWRYHHRLSD